MSYPPPPGQRLPYDQDGTQAWRYTLSGGSLTQLTPTQVTRLNNEYFSGDVVSVGDLLNDYYVEFRFPKAIDLFGVWAAGRREGGPDNPSRFFVDIGVSTNNFVVRGGSWTTISTGFGLEVRYNEWRTEYKALSAEGILGLRGVIGEAFLTGNTELHDLHIYGAPNPAANPDRVLLIDDDTGLEVSSVVDWGDISRGDTMTRVFQVRNNSATHEADDVVIGFNSLNSATVAGWHRVREGSTGTWSTQLSLGPIAPSATYPNDITVSVEPTMGNHLGLFTNRLNMYVTSWST